VSSSAEHLKIDPALATAVRFSADRLHVELSDGREISMPLDRFPRLARAAAQERDHWEVIAFGTAIRWPDLDEDIGVATLLGVPEWLVEQAAGFEAHRLR
jgi:hypothetical protein